MMKHNVLLIYSWFVRTFLYFFPEIKSIMRFRGWLYGLGMKKCGKDFRVTSDVTIKPLEKIEIGENIFIGNGTFILAGSGLIIESKVLIGPKNVIVSGNHTFLNGGFLGPSKGEQIVIGEGAWICANSTITSGAIVPSCSIVAPNTVFGKYSASGSDALYGGGNVAKKIKILGNQG